MEHGIYRIEIKNGYCVLWTNILKQDLCKTVRSEVWFLYCNLSLCRYKESLLHLHCNCSPLVIWRWTFTNWMIHPKFIVKVALVYSSQVDILFFHEVFGIAYSGYLKDLNCRTKHISRIKISRSITRYVSCSFHLSVEQCSYRVVDYAARCWR